MNMNEINDQIIKAQDEKIAILEKRNTYLEGRVDAIDAHEDRMREVADEVMGEMGDVDDYDIAVDATHDC